MERIVNNHIVTYTLSDFRNTQNEFKILFDTTVKTNKYFMDLIYEGINVRTNAQYFSTITSIILNNFRNLNNLFFFHLFPDNN